MNAVARVHERTSASARAFAVAFRILFVSVLFTGLGMALGLFTGILWQIFRSLSGAVDMTLAYRHVAFPTAVTFGIVALIVESVLEFRTSPRNPGR